MAESCIRIKRTLSGVWIWELVTPDGHIAASSADFQSRTECEADARKEGLPVYGGRRVFTTPRSASPLSKNSLVICEDSPGLWQWRLTDHGGIVIHASTRAFLSKRECERDAEQANQTSNDA